MRRNVRSASIPVLTVLCLGLAGCGVGTVSSPTLTPGAALHGTVHGGAQPISGAIIHLYAVGDTGNGSAATDILTDPQGVAPLAFTTTGLDGSFSITGDYSCPTNPATPIYIAATAGNPGLSGAVDNTAIALVAALGPCNALLTAGASQHIAINEATTVAAAWALAPFAISITNIGATSTNMNGITIAFMIANQLINTANSASPNESVAGFATVESAKLYSLADILATCVNSNGTDGACSLLFSPATVNGNTPSDTFSAALNIVQNPANNVGSLYALIPSAPPFPALTAAPADWTMTIAYSNPGVPTASIPLGGTNIATMDQSGNLWATTLTGVAKFSPQLDVLATGSTTNLDGTTISATVSGGGAKRSFMAVDPSGNLWLAAEYLLPPMFVPNPNEYGGVLEYDTNGNMISYANPASASFGYPSGENPLIIAANTDGYIWVGASGMNYTGFQPVNNGGSVSLLNSFGVNQAPSNGWNQSRSFQPGSVAFDGLDRAWFTNTAAAQLLYFPTSTTNSVVADPATVINIEGIAVDLVFDTRNQGWFPFNPASYPNTGMQTNMLVDIDSTGTLLNGPITGSGMFYGSELAIDASDRIWVINLNAANFGNNYCAPLTLSVFSGGAGGGTPLSPIALGSDTHTCSQTGYQSLNNRNAFIIDSSGDILIAGAIPHSSPNTTTGNSGTPALIRFVGLATPTKTPNVGPPQAP